MAVIEGEPGADRVTSTTQLFELEDEQVFAGAGRGPTPSEELAAARAVSLLTSSVIEHYKEMVWRGSLQLGEGRVSC